MIMDWPTGKYFGVSRDGERMLFEETSLYHELHIATQVESNREVEKGGETGRETGRETYFKSISQEGGTEEHDQQMNQAASIEVTQMGLDWQHKD